VSVPVTVIIPTYNWSAALACSISSVLEQTQEDFELLVVGDGCTDDSASVVASFADARIRWHNLAERSGSQSGPNNYGIAAAAGEHVAYLGHDDVWHPEHLRSLLARQAETSADLVCAMAVLYGPPGSGVRAVTGVLVDGRDDVRHFYPPSSILHRRALIDRIGPWRTPRELASPIDCEILDRARAAGIRVAGTGRLTVFKFNASWRRDSYRRRDTSEQRAILDRLRADAAACVEQELTGLVSAALTKRLLDVRMPDTANAAPGEHYRQNLRSRGFDDTAIRPLNGPARFTLDDQASALDWHAVERSPDWGSFRWSGPSPVSTIVLPRQTPERFHLSMEVLNWFHADIASELTISIDGAPVSFQLVQGEHPVVRLEADVVLSQPVDGPLRIQLAYAPMRCPYFLHGSADERWLGVCVRWVELG
jgi:glycosyltransferase involved in cell wall biosynthesis